MTFTNRERWAFIVGCLALSLCMLALVVLVPPNAPDGRAVIATIAAAAAVIMSTRITN
jgi:uncharacterized membrane protein YccC